MLYLYLGFLLTQSHSVINVIYAADIPLITVIFSIVVFLIWSLFPVLGYGLASVIRYRLIKAKLVQEKASLHKYRLFALGCSISLIEQGLFHFDILSRKDGYAAMLVTTGLFFATAFLSHKPKDN